MRITTIDHPRLVNMSWGGAVGGKVATGRPLSCEWAKPKKTNIHPPLSPKFSQNCTFRDNREVFTSLSNPLGTLEQQRLRRSSSSCSWRTGEELCQIREYVGASICIRVTKPSPGRTIGSSGFMGLRRRLGPSWCTPNPPMRSHCLRGRG